MNTLNTNYLPSLSTIITVTLLGSPTVTLLGRENGSIVIIKFSLLSNILSSVNETLIEASVVPAVNVAWYVPDP